MRYSEKTKITISKDLVNDPKVIKFSEDFSDIDVASLAEIVTRDESFPVGTVSIPMGNIASGKFLYIRPEADITFTLNGGSPLVAKGGKATKMWTTVTSLTLTIPAAVPVSVALVIAGS
jgi:hypothetical protein